jgi:hypothetical protein
MAGRKNGYCKQLQALLNGEAPTAFLYVEMFKLKGLKGLINWGLKELNRLFLLQPSSQNVGSSSNHSLESSLFHENRMFLPPPSGPCPRVTSSFSFEPFLKAFTLTTQERSSPDSFEHFRGANLVLVRGFTSSLENLLLMPLNTETRIT